MKNTLIRIAMIAIAVAALVGMSSCASQSTGTKPISHHPHNH